MFEFVGCILYFVLISVSVLRLRVINYRNLSFADGTLVGSLFFIAAPLFLIYLDGSYYIPALKAGDYDPVRDISVTSNLLLGWALTLFASFVSGAGRKHKNAVSVSRDAYYIFPFIVSIAVLTFVLSGKAEAGHWMESMETSLKASSLLILVAVLNNAYRAMIYGYLIYRYETGQSTIIKTFYIGIIIAIIDLALTFNRVTFAYFFITMIIILRRRIYIVVAAVLISWPFVSFASNVWTFVRSNATHNGYSLDGFIEATNQALLLLTASHADASLAEQSGGVFETANILTFSYIVKNVPDNLEPSWGWTLLLRPLTIFLPSTVWAGKPTVFGATLGEQMTGISVALNSTLFGEAYANFYYFWPIVLFLIIILYNWVFGYLKKYIPYAGHFGFMTGFLVGRLELTVASISVFATILIILLLRVVRKLGL